MSTAQVALNVRWMRRASPVAARRAHSALAILLVFAGAWSTLPGQEVSVKPIKDRLREYGISPTPQGVKKYFAELTPSVEQNKRVAKLIKQLGSGRFLERQQASRLLKRMPVPPTAALKEAAEDGDLEISYRAKELLRSVNLGGHESRLILVAGFVEHARISGCVQPILDLAPSWNDPYVLQAFSRTLRNATRAADKPAIEKALEAGSVHQREIAIGGLPAIYGRAQLSNRLFELCADDDQQIRLVAAEHLADIGDPRCLSVLFDLLAEGSGQLTQRVLADLHGLLGQHITGRLNQQQWKDWRTKHSGNVPFRFPTHEAVVADRIQQLGGKVEIDHGEGETNWYTAQVRIPAGPLRVVGVELSQKPFSPTQLKPLRQTNHLRKISFNGSRVTDKGLFHLRDLFQVTEVDLSNCASISDDGLRVLARLPALQHLELGGTNITGSGLVHLTSHSNLRSLSLRRCRRVGDGAMSFVTDFLVLESLDLDETGVTGNGVRMLAKLGQLKSLSLGSKIDDQALASARGLPLESIRFNYSRITEAGLRHLSKLKRLKKLTFYRCPRVNDACLEYIGRLPELEELRLTCPNVSDKGLVFLNQCPKLKLLSLYDSQASGAGLRNLVTMPQLEQLDLGRTAINDDGLRHLAQLKLLRVLNLRTTSVTDAGMAHVAKMKNLRTLVLDSSKVKGPGIERLSQLPELRELRMHNTRLTDDSARHLANLTKLEILDISNTQITDAAMIPVGRLPRLRDLDISRSSVGNRGLQALRQCRTLRRLRIRLTSVSNQAAQELTLAIKGLSWSR